MGTTVGTVGYLNARPLTDAIDRTRWPVVADVPSRIATELAEGRVDVALVPVAGPVPPPSSVVTPLARAVSICWGQMK